MKFIRQLIAKKSSTQKGGDDSAMSRRLEPQPHPTVRVPPHTTIPPFVGEQKSTEVIGKVSAEVQEEAPAPQATPAPVNIWDMDGEDSDALPEPIAPAPVKDAVSIPEPIAGRSKRRPGRAKTRLIGFEKSATDVVDLFDPESTVRVTQRATFPVGWVVVTDGPGRGESFALYSGMSQIGRGEDQTVQLDFGDNAISRTNHAAIVYDAETHKFLLGHGGKSNIVRLNDAPVVSTEPLADGDSIKIGDTTLRFVGLCNETFNWSDKPDSKESDDVAIA